MVSIQIISIGGGKAELGVDYGVGASVLGVGGGDCV